jgi:hypothetical protein
MEQIPLVDDRIEGGLFLFLFFGYRIVLSSRYLGWEAKLLIDDPLDDIGPDEGKSPGKYQVENPKISPKNQHALPQKS